METLTQIGIEFPFRWANLESYRKSSAYRKEIYIKNEVISSDEFISLFYFLFSDNLDNLIVYNKHWWNFCLDTWDISNDTYDYDLQNKSKETQMYLTLLIENQIQADYSGCCACKNWSKFLRIIIECLIKNIAPYSPLFCDVKNDYFFYFHHTGSIGIYYKYNNEFINNLFLKSESKYTIIEV